MKFEVWTEMAEGAVIRYQGIQDIRSRQYFIVNGYRFYHPVNLKSVADSDEIFVELLTSMISEKSIQWYSTIDEAITSYNTEFSNS